MTDTSNLIQQLDFLWWTRSGPSMRLVDCWWHWMQMGSFQQEENKGLQCWSRLQLWGWKRGWQANQMVGKFFLSIYLNFLEMSPANVACHNVFINIKASDGIEYLLGLGCVVILPGHPSMGGLTMNPCLLSGKKMLQITLTIWPTTTTNFSWLLPQIYTLVNYCLKLS